MYNNTDDNDDNVDNDNDNDNVDNDNKAPLIIQHFKILQKRVRKPKQKTESDIEKDIQEKRNN